MPLSTDPWFTEGDPFAQWPGDEEGLSAADLAALEKAAAPLGGTSKVYTETQAAPAPSSATKPAATASGTKVARDSVHTPLTVAAAIQVLAVTFRLVAQTEPFFGQLVFAAAQCGLETAQFKALYGYNLGNLSWNISWLPETKTPLYWESTTDKGWKGAVFQNAAIGGVAYWRLMRSKTWRHVLAIAGRERYEDAAEAAVRAGYAAPEALASYKANVPALAKAYAPIVSKARPGLRRAMPSAAVAGAAGLVLVGGAAAVAYKFRNR